MLLQNIYENTNAELKNTENDWKTLDQEFKRLAGTCNKGDLESLSEKYECYKRRALRIDT